MKINYDFSNFGRTLILGGAVNGITRVIDELASSIFSTGEKMVGCEVAYSSDYYPQARRLIESYFYSKGHQIVIPNDTYGNEILYDVFVNYKFPFHKGQKLGRVLNYGTCMKSADIYYASFFPPQKERRARSGLVFTTIYDIIFETSPQYFTDDRINGMKDLYRRILDNTDYYFAISEYTKERFCDHYRVDESKVFVTPLAASSKFVACDNGGDEVRLKYGIRPDQRYILSLATVEPRKNFNSLLKSFRSLKAELSGEEVKLVICGSLGWKYSDTLELINDSSYLSENVILTGYVPEEDLPAIYSGALLFCYIPFEEGFGLPPLEAMSCGTPVLSSNTSSIPEVVGEAGILIDPYSISSISDGLINLIRNEGLRGELSAKGVEQAKKFSWNRTSQEMLNIFEQKY